MNERIISQSERTAALKKYAAYDGNMRENILLEAQLAKDTASFMEQAKKLVKALKMGERVSGRCFKCFSSSHEKHNNDCEVGQALDSPLAKMVLAASANVQQ